MTTFFFSSSVLGASGVGWDGVLKYQYRLPATLVAPIAAPAISRAIMNYILI
jgi:hypothetical protein